MNRKQYAGLALVLTILLSGGAYWGIGQLETEVDFVDTVPDHPGLAPYRALLAELDGVRFAALYHALDPDSGFTSLRDDGFDALVNEQGNLTEDIFEAYPDAFTNTLSAWEGMRQGNYMLAKLATAGNPPPGSYSFPEDPVRYDLVKQQILGDDTLDDVLSPGGESALMLFFLAEMPDAEARALVLELEDFLQTWTQQQDRHPATHDHSSTGLVYASAYTDSRNVEEIQRLLPYASVSVLVVLALGLRRVDDVLVALSTMGLALLWTFGLLGALGIPLSFLTVVLTPILLGVGIDGSLHALLHLRQAQRDGVDDPWLHTLQAMAPAVIIAGLTTATGLAMLLFIPSPMFAQIGGVAALGMLVSLAATALVVPAFSLWSRPSRPRKRQQSALRDLPLVRQVSRWGSATLLVGVLIASGIVLPSLPVESGSSENEFPQDDPVIQLQQRIEDEYGAFQRAYLVMQGDITEPEALQVLHIAINASGNLPLFRQASSITTILLANEATDQGAADIAISGILGGLGQAPSEEQRLPQTQEEARQQLDALFEDPLWSSIAPFTINQEYTLAIVAIEIDPWQDQTELLALRDALVSLQDALREQLPAGLSLHAAGSPMNRAAIVEATTDHVRLAIFGVAGALLPVLLVFTWRWGALGRRIAFGATLTATLAALLLLMSIPVLDAVYQFEGVGNRATLTDMFLIAFALAVAVGVDDLVHIGAAYHRHRHEPFALHRAMRETFGKISLTSLTAVAGFLALTNIYFLQSRTLMILSALGMVLAYGVTLLVAPLLLEPRRRQSVE